MKLTNTTCKNAKAKPKAYKLADGQGLYLEVMPNGHKYWRMKYRHTNKEKRLSIGVFPETGLAEARALKEAARKLIAQNIDPSFAKQEDKRIKALNAENTFEALALEWHTLENGTHRTIADVWFNVDQRNSFNTEDYTFDIRAAFLPSLRGFGQMKDLHQAMSEDETLLDLMADLVANDNVVGWPRRSLGEGGNASRCVTNGCYGKRMAA